MPKQKGKPLIVAFSGAPCTGKTTCMHTVQKQRPQWFYVFETTRTLMPKLGYAHAWEVIDKVGIAFYESMMLSHWGIVDSACNPFCHKKLCLVDRSPWDNLAYYYALRQPDEDKYESILMSLTRHYARCVDVYLFFPTAAIPFVNDEMRIEDVGFQLRYEEILVRLLRESGHFVYTMQETDLVKRADEVIGLLENLNKK